MIRFVFYHPEIPPNTGNAIRLSAVTGCELHLIAPLGFDLDDAKLRRAGLDYHDLANVTVHADLDAAWGILRPERVFAFSTQATTPYTDVTYRPSDILLFGPESVGLPAEIQHAPEITDRLRIPMKPSRRSLNLANCASIAIYEAWRQQGFAGAG